MAFGLVPTQHYARAGFGPRPRHAVPARHGPFKTESPIGPTSYSYFLRPEVRNPNPNPSRALVSFSPSPLSAPPSPSRLFAPSVPSVHNLFGDTNAAHISVKDGKYSIDQIFDGETVEEVLDYVQYNPKNA